MQTLKLPRWVQWSAAIGFLAVPLIACGVSFIANVIYSSQFGYLAMAISAASEIARVTIMIVVVLLAGWTWQLRIVILVAGLYTAWTATNLAMDERFQVLWGRAEQVTTYSDNKAEIARLARDLSQITEVSTSSALKSQVNVLSDRIKFLSENIAIESDPSKGGPCRNRCLGYKAELDKSQVELAKLQDRLGQAQKREQLEKSITEARGKRNVEASEVKQLGLTAFLSSIGQVKRSNADFANLLINTIFYLLLVEGLSYLMVPAIRAVLAVAYAPVEKKEEETISVAKMEEILPEKPQTMEALVAKLQEEVPEIVKPLRRRRQDGRFAKRPGPKPKKDLPKLKLRDLPRPAGENVVDIGSRHKDFNGDE